MKTLTLKTSALFMLLALVPACGKQLVQFNEKDTPATVAAIIAPVVTSTLPANKAKGGALNTTINATFSKEMDATSLTATSFTVKQGATEIAGKVSYAADSRTARFTPTANLENSLVYTSTISVAAKDTEGNVMEKAHTWTFTTTDNTDVLVAPTVIAVIPENNDVNVSINRQPAATFSKVMDPATINATTVTMRQGTTPVTGTVTLNGATNTARFAPGAPLGYELAYTVTISTGAKDSAGLAMVAAYAWTFTTAASPVAPIVASTSPEDNDTGVLLAKNITATFSKSMDAATILAPNTFTMKQGVTVIGGTVTFNGATNTATFNPTLDLDYNLVYTMTMSTAARDAGNLAMAADFVWSFTTVTAPVAPIVVSTTPDTNGANVSRDVNPTAIFSKTMNAASVTNPLTFTMAQGATPVPGTVTYNAATNTATFTPSSKPLAYNLVYTMTISTGALDSSGVAMAADYEWSFTTVATPLTPVVLLTTPDDNATGVTVGTHPTATFNMSMDSLTINDTTFIVKQGLADVLGTVLYDDANHTATFTPNVPFGNDLVYTATINTGAQSSSNVALGSDFVWDFTTVDAAAPTITLTDPANLAVNISVSTNIKATFSEDMKISTMIAANFLVAETLSSAMVTVSVAYDVLNKRITLLPDSDLKADTDYTVTVTTGAQDLAGNALVAGIAANPWSFKTAAGDTTAPTITFTNPASGATNVAFNANVNVTFSELMDASAMNITNITVKNAFSNMPVTGTVTYNALDRIVTFTPDSYFLSNTSYTVTVTNVTDLAGNELVVPAVGLFANPFTFTTGPTPVLAVNLGVAETFGLASQSGLTSSGVTVIDGDVALYPLATCDDATGGPGGASQDCLTRVYSSTTGMTVNGFIYYAADPFDSGQTAMEVQSALNAAWVEGKAKVVTQGTVAADEMGGKIFLPGVYHNATLGLMAGGIAVLDAANDANAVFIFQVDSSFVDSGTLLLPSSIVLTRGAQARNVWFIVGLDLTIGSGSTFNGNILAGRDATILDGSTVTGRILAGAANDGSGALTITGAAAPSVTRIIVPQ